MWGYNNKPQRGGGNKSAVRVDNVGNRRPSYGNNFVPSGQLANPKGGPQSNQQQKTVQIPKQQQAPQQQQQSPQAKSTTQQPPPSPQTKLAQQAKPAQQAQATPQPVPPVQTPVKLGLKQEQAPPAYAPEPPPAPKEDTSMEVKDGTDPPKKKWIQRNIPKSEIRKKRDKRLSKVLQPKGALMVLNELQRNLEFVLDKIPDEMNLDCTYKATVNVNGVDYVGYGRNKPAAKNDASENALKSLFRRRTALSAAKSEDQMDTSENETPNETGVLWEQIASFAIHKLLSSWGDSIPTVKDDVAPPVNEQKPAKKLPDNAAAMNPVMVVHQFYPNAHFVELSRTGTPPNMLFSLKCTIDGKEYFGSGTSKKFAKKQISFVICSELLGIQYPPEIYVKNG